MQQESFDAECLGTSDLTHTAQVVIANPHALINKSPPPDTHSFVVEKRLSHQGVNFDFYKQLTTQEWYLGVVFPSTATHNDTIEQLKVVGVTPENDFHSLQDLIHRVVDLSKDLTPHVPMDSFAIPAKIPATFLQVFQRRILLSLAKPAKSTLTMKQILEKFPDADFPSITIDVLSAIKFRRSPLHSLGPHNLRALIQLMLNVEIGTYPEVLKSAVCQTVYPELNGLTVYHVQSATKSDLPSQFSHVAGFNILNLLNVHHPKFVKSLQYKYTAEAKNSGVSQFTPAHYFWIDTDALNIYHKGIVNFNSEFPTPEQFKEAIFTSYKAQLSEAPWGDMYQPASSFPSVPSSSSAPSTIAPVLTQATLNKLMQAAKRRSTEEEDSSSSKKPK